MIDSHIISSLSNFQSAFRWEPPFAMVVRIPVMAISQTYFFIRAWRLFSKPYWIAVAWAIAVSAEVATGEADFLVTVFQRSAANTKPHSTIGEWLRS